MAAGLQLVFGVQRIVNLACGSFYAVGAYFGITAVRWGIDAGTPPSLFILLLLASGVLLAVVMGPLIERLLIRFVYDREESFQLLLTFAIVLMFEDIIRFVWGTSPAVLGGGLYLAYGQLRVGTLTIPVYNLLVIAASALIAGLMAWFLARTRLGRSVRATAENRAMSEALGVNMARVYVLVFSIGVALGTVGGALVAPATAAALDLGIELIVEAFAVVVIGGLGSMPGAFVGAIVVGLMKAASIATYPELEMLAIYLVVIAVLVLRPVGLFAKPT